ncbi:MAG: LysR family transcriptional regulator [Pseudomonadota bacterium]
MDRLESMRVFVRIVEQGSLAAAAKASGISATMAGNHLRELEKYLGAQLLHRTTRSQHLTAFGEDYLPRCQEILRLIAETQAHAQDQQVAPKGTLRITAPVSYGAEALMPALTAYLARHPDVKVDLLLTDNVVDLVEQGVEVAIRIGALPDSGLIVRALAPYRMMICAAPAYLQQRGTPLTPDMLSAHDCLSFSHAALSHWRLKHGEQAVSVPVCGRLKVNNGQALRMAALHGLGIIMQPAVLLEEDVKAGRLIELFAEYDPGSRPVNLLYLPDRYRSSKIGSFVDFIVAKLG